MHYYLYPKGTNAKVVAWGLENFFENVSFSFIDDGDPISSLEANLEIIKKGIEGGEAEILICSKRFCDVILEKLFNNGIRECRNGLELVANKINAYYKDKFPMYKRIGILLDGYGANQKHLGNIPMYLQKFGFKVIYLIVPDSEWLEDIKGKGGILSDDELVYVTDEFLELFDFYPFIIFQNERLTKLNPNITSLKLFVTAEQMSNQIVRHNPNYAAMEVLGNGLCDYVNVHSESLYNAMLERLSEVKKTVGVNNGKFLKGGYPSIDKQIADFTDKDCKRDTIIFISSHGFYENCMDFVEEAVWSLIDKYRILWKSHPVFVKKLSFEEEMSLIKKFMHHKNFVYYREARLNQAELERSICIMVNTSSMGYSYPPLAKRPAILLYPSESVKLLQTTKDAYYNPKIHIRYIQASAGGGNCGELVSIVRNLAEDKATQQQWKDKIEDYCKNDLFNYGCASEFIAKWICNWYKNREILKESC